MMKKILAYVLWWFACLTIVEYKNYNLIYVQAMQQQQIATDDDEEEKSAHKKRFSVKYDDKSKQARDFPSEENMLDLWLAD